MVWRISYPPHPCAPIPNRWTLLGRQSAPSTYTPMSCGAEKASHTAIPTEPIQHRSLAWVTLIRGTASGETCRAFANDELRFCVSAALKQWQGIP